MAGAARRARASGQRLAGGVPARGAEVVLGRSSLTSRRDAPRGPARPRRRPRGRCRRRGPARPSAPVCADTVSGRSRRRCRGGPRSGCAARPALLRSGMRVASVRVMIWLLVRFAARASADSRRGTGPLAGPAAARSTSCPACHQRVARVTTLIGPVRAFRRWTAATRVGRPGGPRRRSRTISSSTAGGIGGVDGHRDQRVPARRSRLTCMPAMLTSASPRIRPTVPTMPGRSS